MSVTEDTLGFLVAGSGNLGSLIGLHGMVLRVRRRNGVSNSDPYS